ncbi:MAG TPA: amidohydrolase family protein [Ohtaekwangia sp.]|nr:amidohydrolase family protein [Ohtaekwangia sp.]
MQRIDAHQHFWKYTPDRDQWITDNMGIIKRDFLPEDIAPVLQRNNIDGCVVVQSSQSTEENHFQLNNASAHECIKGVVGWVDFQASDIDEQLSYYKQFGKMKGFRHVLQDEKERDFMLQRRFMDGIGLLKDHNFTYDLLVLPDQLKYLRDFVSIFPDQRFVLDHLAKPHVKEKEILRWKKDIVALASHENVYCKVSGMITEADWHTWRSSDFTPYLDVVVESFGMKRLMFGSDWPVCLLAGTYERMLAVVTEYFGSFSQNEQQLLYGKNAIDFYNL